MRLTYSKILCLDKLNKNYTFNYLSHFGILNVAMITTSGPARNLKKFRQRSFAMLY